MLLEVLCKRWREPTFTVHGMQSGAQDVCGRNMLIPQRITAHFSARLVPDQEPKEIFQKIREHLEQKFAELKSPCSLHVELHKYGDWWLGNVQHPIFRAARDAIEQVQTLSRSDGYARGPYDERVYVESSSSLLYSLST